MQDFHSECPVCGGREHLTGKSELREGKRYFEFQCSDCRSVGWEWHRELDTPDRPTDV